MEQVTHSEAHPFLQEALGYFPVFGAKTSSLCSFKIFVCTFYLLMREQSGLTKQKTEANIYSKT